MNLTEYITIISNGFTIVASGIAIYIFITKRESIYSAFNLLINYSYQLSLSELKEKLEKLNDYKADDPEQYKQIINILHEIIGQIRGNDKLKDHFSEMLQKLETLLSSKRKLSEPTKRAIVSELRERIRNVNVKNFDDLVGE